MINNNYYLENEFILNKYHKWLEETESIEGDDFTYMSLGRST